MLSAEALLEMIEQEKERRRIERARCKARLHLVKTPEQDEENAPQCENMGRNEK